MPQLTPDQAITILNVVGLPSINAERPITKAVIAAIPAGKANFQPDPIARPALELAWHIVMAEKRFLDAVAAGAFDLTPKPKPDSIRTPADVVAWHDRELDGCVDRLKRMTGEQLIAPIDFRGMFKFPAVVYVQLAMSHTVHHRGQLSMYLRPMGAKVPSIYGESYDAREERERAAQVKG